MTANLLILLNIAAGLFGISLGIGLAGLSHGVSSGHRGYWLTAVLGFIVAAVAAATWWVIFRKYGAAS